MTSRAAPAAPSQAGSAGLVLMTLASAQFLMTLDSSVMNVSIAQVAKDVDTTITGVQTAITLYTLVMATLMITGGKIGTMIGRRRAFSIGCVIYGCRLPHHRVRANLTVLIIGWSVARGRRRRADHACHRCPGRVQLPGGGAAARLRPGRVCRRHCGRGGSPHRRCVHDLSDLAGGLRRRGGHRARILVLSRKIQDTTAPVRVRLDVVGAVLSAAGLGLAVFGVLRSGEWGWVLPKPDAPLALASRSRSGWSSAAWSSSWSSSGGSGRIVRAGREPLVDTSLLRNPRLAGGLTMFFFQFLLQAGLFFTVPLFLSVALGLQRDRDRSTPAAALGHPARRGGRCSQGLAHGVAAAGGHLGPGCAARRHRVVDGRTRVGAGPEIVTVPLLLAGLGVGALASQLGAVTVSSVSDRAQRRSGRPAEHATNLGASLGTALAGSILIGGLTASFIHGIEDNPAVPDSVSLQRRWSSPVVSRSSPTRTSRPPWTMPASQRRKRSDRRRTSPHASTGSRSACSCWR